jgi:uncharacterized phage-like protein YoqJ
MIIAVTGHRPNKLPNKETGYKLPNPTYIYVCQQLEKMLLDLKPEKVISGMALGVDMWFAHIAYKLGIPFLAAVPFEGQEKAWPQASQSIYKLLLNKAVERVVVCEGGYSADKMQLRNELMCDKADLLICVWDGSNGGTGNCVRYAESIGKKIIRIDPRLDS